MKKFRTFAVPDRNIAFVNVFSFNPITAEYLVEVTIHEILHLFDANDKYDENEEKDGYCTKKGLADPDKSPPISSK